MIRIGVRVAALYRKYWLWLGGISALITLIKLGDLVVPLLGGKVIELIERDGSADRTVLWLLVTVSVWLVHGNLLPWVYNSIDARKVELFARRDLSLWSLGRVKAAVGQDSAMLQTLIERGEAVIPDFVVSVSRVLLPSVLPCLAVVLALIAISPRLFVALALGCGAYGALTFYMNRRLMPRYAHLQDVDNLREQLRIKIFRLLAEPSCPIEGMIASYGHRFDKVAEVGSHVRARYLNFDLSRGLIINAMNACTWIIGIHAVQSGQFGLAVFLAFVSWSTACISYVQAVTGFHKQWLEIGPAMRNYFLAVGALEPLLPQTEALAPEAFQPAE